MNLAAEHPQDERHGSDALAALDASFQDMTAPARLALSIKDISFQKLGRWVVCTVKFREDVQLNGEVVNEVKIRMPRARAEVARLHLGRLLGA